jgi:hypothetical protein
MPPSLWVVVVLLLSPPLVCVAWYVVWRRLNPDAGCLKERRRSRAARQALSRLENADRAPLEQRPPLVAAALAGYLRERTDLTVAEPTPPEALACLRRAGCSAAVVDRAVAFLHTCDAARFWPPVAADCAKLPTLARDVILALDADTEAPKEPVPHTEEVWP